MAFTAKMVDVKAAASADFFFQKVFGDGNFMAAGQLVLPPKGQKPTKSTKDNTFVRTFNYNLMGTADALCCRSSTSFRALLMSGSTAQVLSLRQVECSLFPEVCACARSFLHLVNAPLSGNMYYIQNVTDRDTKLFFAQARRNIEDMVQDSDRDRSPTAVE